MARGEHLKNPTPKSPHAVIRVKIFTEEGVESYEYFVRGLTGCSFASQRKALIKEALESKFGKNIE